MKTRTLIALLIVVALLAGIAVVVFRTGTEEKPILGKELLAEFPYEKVERIRIQSAKGVVNLVKTGSGWVVEERNGFPAEFSKISDTVKKLRDLKVGRQFALDDELTKRLSLRMPGESGSDETSAATRLQLLDKSGKVLMDLLLGSERESESGFGGQYVMRTGEPTIYLVDGTFKFLAKDPAEWLHREIFNVDRKAVRSVTHHGTGATAAPYELRRDDPNAPFALSPPSKVGPLKISQVDRVTDGLSPLRIEDVSLEKVDFTGASSFDYLLFDGSHCRIELGPSFTKDGETFTHARFTVDPPSANPAAKSAPAEPQKPEALFADTADFSRWVYVLSRWKSEDFIRDPRMLIEPPVKKDKKK